MKYALTAIYYVAPCKPVPAHQRQCFMSNAHDPHATPKDETVRPELGAIQSDVYLVGRVSPQGVTRQNNEPKSGYAALTVSTELRGNDEWQSRSFTLKATL